jgi:two-component sensor histidine kinase
VSPTVTDSGSSFGASEYARAVLNILEDFAAEKERLQDTQRAILNILEDSGLEKLRLEETERAVLNILEDFGSEKRRLEDTQKAVLNILDDLGVEKSRLEDSQREVVRSEQAVRGSLREKEVLLKEIHHRVKNNLQVISSLLNLQARYLTDPAAREIFNESQNRVQSIALVHEKLYQSANLSHIDFAEYVVSLVDNLFHTHDAAERGIRRELDLGGVRLAIDLAIPCGLIINELITNCLKHAFRGRPGGVVEIAMHRLDGGALELVVADDGNGMPADLDPRHTQSLGLDLVFTFAEQIEAEVAIAREGGTRFRFTFAAEQGGV